MMTRLNSLKAALVRYSSSGATSSQGASMQESMRRISRRWLPLLGWPGIVAIGLTVMCIPLYFSMIAPVQERLNQLKRADSALSERSASADNALRGASNPVDELEEFYRHFPPEKNSPRWLGKMAEIATKNGINLNHGEYIVTRDKVGRLVRFKITLPVQARYTQIRKFLSVLNSEIPNMALENVQFQRKDVLDSDVQVKIRLQLYMVQES
jgi:hypothetical protein